MKTYLIILSFLIFFLLTGLREADAALTLTMNPTSITFPDQDPTAYPSTQATATVSVSCRTTNMAGVSWSLHVVSNGDLVSTGSTIPIANISWTAVKNTGDNQVFYYGGNMTKTSPGTLVVSGKGNDTTTGTLTFYIQNLWTYYAGNYSQTVVFTMTAP